MLLRSKQKEQSRQRETERVKGEGEGSSSRRITITITFFTGFITSATTILFVFFTIAFTITTMKQQKKDLCGCSDLRRARFY